MDKRMVISADSHVVEPLDLWVKTLGHKYADQLPRLVDTYNGQPGKYMFTGFDYFDWEVLTSEDDPTKGDNPEARKIVAEKLLTAGYDPVARVKCLDEDGVYAEVLNATIAMLVLRARNDDMARDCCLVFNDWLAEFCSQYPKRLFGNAMIHMQEVDWAVKELERAARRGFKGVVINVDTRPEWDPYRHKKYDPFWACAQELDMPVILHILTGNFIDGLVLHGDQRSECARFCIRAFEEVEGPLTNEFIFGGIFDRFPRLKVICEEFETSWVLYWLFRAKQVQDVFAPMLGLPRIKLPVEEYLRRHVYFGVIDDLFVSQALEVIDPSRIMWGSDFPHPRCTYPKSLRIIDDLFGRLGPEVRDGIAWKNVAHFYNLEEPPALTS